MMEQTLWAFPEIVRSFFWGIEHAQFGYSVISEPDLLIPAMMTYVTPGCVLGSHGSSIISHGHALCSPLLVLFGESCIKIYFEKRIHPVSVGQM